MWGSLNKPGAHGENVGNGRDLQCETSGSELSAAQRSEAEQHAVEFLKKVVRVPGVRINRDDFLRQELRERGVPEEVIRRAIDTSPAFAGVPLADLDRLAEQAISYETNKSAAMSFAAGIPGGFAMLGTIPADLTQYYVHAFRIMQKLAYLYGWRELLSDMDEVDDETIGVLAVFFGVMLGVGGAAQSLTAFARSVAVPAFQKQVTKQALTKTSWYPVMKHCLRYIGINLTKKGFAQGVSKAIPLIGGAVSGGMTFVSLQSQSHRLKNHLRELPAPGVDAEVWKQAVSDATPDDQEPGVLDNAQQALESTTKAVTSGAKTAATGIADGAMTAASGIAEGVKGLFGRRK